MVCGLRCKLVPGLYGRSVSPERPPGSAGSRGVLLTQHRLQLLLRACRKGKACEWPLLSGSPLFLPPSAVPAPALPSGLCPLTLGIHAQVLIPCPLISLPGGGSWQMVPARRLPQEAGSQTPSSLLALRLAWQDPRGVCFPAPGWTCLEWLVPPNRAAALGPRPGACPDMHGPRILPPPPEPTRGVFPRFYSAPLGSAGQTPVPARLHHDSLRDLERAA